MTLVHVKYTQRQSIHITTTTTTTTSTTTTTTTTTNNNNNNNNNKRLSVNLQRFNAVLYGESFLAAPDDPDM